MEKPLDNFVQRFSLVLHLLSCVKYGVLTSETLILYFVLSFVSSVVWLHVFVVVNWPCCLEEQRRGEWWSRVFPSIDANTRDPGLGLSKRSSYMQIGAYHLANFSSGDAAYLGQP
jgi:hypothetical protein